MWLKQFIKARQNVYLVNLGENEIAEKKIRETDKIFDKTWYE